MWAVLYDDGTSLTTVSEPIARSLAEAERQRGHRVTIRRLDHDGDGAPESEPDPEPETAPAPELAPAPEPARAPEPAQMVEPVERAPAPEPVQAVEPTPAPEPAQAVEPTLAPEPAQAVEPARAAVPAPVPTPAREPEPARGARPARGRRLLLYALAAGCIVVGAAMADHWDALPRVGATTSSSPAQVGGPPHRSQLLPPLDQPPVMHFSNAVRARSAPGPQSATGQRSGGGQSANAWGG
jgi:outer membrane biosynthesis protein TonB